MWILIAALPQRVVPHSEVLQKISTWNKAKRPGFLGGWQTCSECYQWTERLMDV